jgi:xylan 1,4-beta-xylosidase
VDPDKEGATNKVVLNFSHVPPGARVTVERVDEQHGNVLERYAAMGKPLDPTQAQVERLNRETTLPAPEDTRLQGGKLELSLTPNTLALVKVSER